MKETTHVLAAEIVINNCLTALTNNFKISMIGIGKILLRLKPISPGETFIVRWIAAREAKRVIAKNCRQWRLLPLDFEDDECATKWKRSKGVGNCRMEKFTDCISLWAGHGCWDVGTSLIPLIVRLWGCVGMEVKWTRFLDHECNGVDVGNELTIRFQTSLQHELMFCCQCGWFQQV